MSQVSNGSSATLRWLLLLLIPGVPGMVIQRVTGANQSEISHASSAGGSHVYIFGTDIGSAFSPPTVYLGTNADAQCVVQPFTSNRNRLHCIISGDGLPAPDLTYSATAKFVSEPLRVYKDGRLADCWHVGGINHGCFLTFDVAGTPRVTRVLTQVVEAGSFVRVMGNGIDGGLTGDPKIMSALHRGSRDAGLGSCGQKDCQSSNMGTETVGCISREGGDEGDSVLGQRFAVSLAFSDANNYGCQLDTLASKPQLKLN